MVMQPELDPAVGPMVPELYELSKIRRELPDTYTLALSAQNGASLSYAAGQFNMLYAFGVGEVPISVSGDPARPGPLLHTIRAVGATTRALCAMKPGAVVGVRGPFGRPWPVEEYSGCDVVVVAGGLGLAPVRSALYHVLEHRRDYGRVVLLYGTRTPRDILYGRELQRWRGRFDLDVEVTVDHAAGERFENVGVVTQLVPPARFDPDEAVAFVCGPEVMMRFTVQKLLQRGLDASRIFLSMERNMKCAIGSCGHCQFGPNFVCKDGPVFSFADVAHLFRIREV